MGNNILFKRSNVLNDDGSIKFPDSSSVEYGEICVNYKNNHEVIAIKNSSSEIKTFSTDKDIDTLDSAPTENTSISSYGIPYNIGDKVRVSDSIEKNGYKLYKLIDKKSDGKMVWEIVYSDEKIKPYYFIIDQTVSDPYKMISSAITGNSRGAIEWIRSNSHRYLGTYVSGDDMMYLCQLDDNDSEKFLDGTNANLTGERGDVFMKLPTFYYKAENTSGNNWKIGFSMDKVDSTWKTWAGNDLIGAFEAIYTSSKLRSIKSSSESTGNKSWANFRTYARNTYGENHGKIVTWEQHCIMAFLYYAYYLNTNCQAQCGSGYDSYDKPCGQQLSMIDTTSSNGNTTKGINFWGLENWWGNKTEWVDNVSGGSNVFTVTTYDGTTGAWGSYRNANAFPVGYFAHMAIGEYLDASALDSTAASDTLGYCDYFYNSGSSRIVYRSGLDSHPYGGVSFAAAGISPSSTRSDFGSRLSYVGPWTLLTSTEYLNKINSMGVFIQDIDGNLYTTSEWDNSKTANGIAVLTDKVRVLLALTENSSTMQMSSSYTDPLENYTTGTTDGSVATVDYNGQTNTTNIMKLQSSTNYAASWCNSFTFPDGKTKGYLPALGELYEIYQNKSAVDAALSACGGTAMSTNDYYWSSTFYCVNINDIRSCWMLFWNRGNVSFGMLNDTLYVRAVASLD